MSERIVVERKVLSENDRLAAEIRERMCDKRIVSLNLVSSPGSGKTSLLERMLTEVGEDLCIVVIAGDVQTENDADRLKRAGGKIVKPVTTGGACHLDARMIIRVIDRLDLNNVDLLVVENVGNLVCPASYDLGEDMKVALVSTTEGDDKPLKYPAMFRRSSALIVNKIDLLGLSDFNIKQVKRNALAVNPSLRIFEISCRTGEGLRSWYSWLRELVETKKTQTSRI